MRNETLIKAVYNYALFINEIAVRREVKFDYENNCFEKLCLRDSLYLIERYRYKMLAECFCHYTSCSIKDIFNGIDVVKFRYFVHDAMQECIKYLRDIFLMHWTIIEAFIEADLCVWTAYKIIESKFKPVLRLEDLKIK